MATPHACPICGGNGKIYSPQPFTSPTTAPLNYPQLYKSCHACGGTGIVWEQSYPLLPRMPEFTPYIPPVVGPLDPGIGLTFPEDFKYPEDIVKSSKKSLISKLKDMIKSIEETGPDVSDEQEPEQTTEDIDDEFCD